MIVEFEGKRPVIAADAFIAPNAVLIGDVRIESGVSIWFGAVLRGDLAPIFIGAQANIQDNCSVHVDRNLPVTVEPRVTVGHNCVVHGCTIETKSLIGMNSVILNGAVVKAGCIVAAGSVVKAGQVVGPGHLVAGVPAQFKKEVDPSDRAGKKEPWENYVSLSARYAPFGRP